MKGWLYIEVKVGLHTSCVKGRSGEAKKKLFNALKNKNGAELHELSAILVLASIAMSA